MRGEQAARQHNLLRLLQNARNGMRIDQLAKELGRNARTVRRDLYALRDQQTVPLYSENTERGTVWKLDLSWRNAEAILLSPEEMNAIIIARKVVAPDESTNGIAHALDSLIQKLKCQRPEEFRRKADLVDQSIIRGAGEVGPFLDFIPHMELVTDAIRRKRRIRFDYTSWEGERTEGRFVAPLFFNLSEGQVYLTGHCYLREAIRTFVPDKMENLKITDEIVTEDFKIDPREYAKAALGGFYSDPEPVLLRLLPWMTGYFSRNVAHPTQELFQENGGHYLRMHAGVNWALVWWICRYGENVEVLEPEYLREWVGDILKNAAEQYAT